MDTDRITTILGALSGISGAVSVMFPKTAIFVGPVFAVIQALKGYYTNKRTVRGSGAL